MESDSLLMKNVSFIKARDPSILLAFNRPQLAEIKTKLADQFAEQPEDIRVYLRIKNNGYDFRDLYEIDGNVLTSKVPPGSNCLRNVKEGDSMKKVYTFSKIFEPQSTQREIFNYVVKPKLLDFINGQNSTLLTYGASGSGKTFTVIGTDEEPGIVPRSLTYLFRTLPQLTMAPSAKPSPAGDVTLLSESDCRKEKMVCKNLLNGSLTSMDRNHHAKTYLAMQQRLSCEPAALLEDLEDVSIGVWVSFAEIYNEQIYDLLQVNPKGKQRKRLPLGMYNGNAYIKHLTSVNVTSGQEAYQILQFGLTNLNYASTHINSHSSRSHSIFTIKLVQVSRNNECYVSSFHICDLAGSERSKKTHNVGDRLKESNSINSSLLVLSRCISAVRDGQKQNDHKLVPFRESKLTQLFQKALSGSEDIAMIVNINPSREMFDESQHVLNFSAVAKEITIEHKPEITTKKKNRFSQLVEGKSEVDEEFNGYTIQDYKDIILALREEMEQRENHYEVTEKLNLDYLRQGYDDLLKQNELHVRQRILDAEESVRLNYEMKMDNMKRYYEKQIRELIKEKRDEVIEIESSDDDDDEEEEETEADKMKECDLRQTLKEGVREYRELKDKYELLELENLKLREKMCDLENELECYRQQFVNQYIDENNGSESGSDDYMRDNTI